MCCLLKPVWADVLKQVSGAVMSVAVSLRVRAESTFMYQTGPLQKHRLNTTTTTTTTIIIIIIIIIVTRHV